MKKDTFYFTHDYHARSDMKLVHLRMNHGLSGLGLYWCLIEMLYEAEGSLPLTHFNIIAFQLQIDIALVEDVVTNYDLFQNDGDVFWSKSVNDRMMIREQMAENGKKMAKSRWQNVKISERNANASDVQCDTQCDTQCTESDTALLRKERKGKEKKGKEIKVKENNNNLIEIEKHEFSDFIDANCHNLKKMKTPMNPKQASELSSIYGFQAVCDVLLAMDNKPDIAKKYSSVGQTARQWLKNRKPETNAKPTFTEHATQWLQSIAEHRANRGN